MENAEVIELLKDAFEMKRQAKYKRAMELLYKALAICPDNAEILLQVAEIHTLLENYSQAINLYEQLLEKNPSEVDILEQLSDFYLKTFEYDKVRILLAKFILAYPSEKAYSIYFKTLFVMKEYENIIEFYNDKNLGKYEDTEIDRYYTASLCCLKRYQEAESLLKTLSASETSDKEIKYYYAECLYSLEDVDGAQVVLESIFDGDNSAKVYNLFGEIELSKNHLENAAAMFAKAVKLQYNGLYFYNLATAYFLNGQLDEAKGFYIKAVSASPEIPEYRYAQAYLYFKQQNIKKAMQVVEELLEKYPASREARLLKAELLIAENKFFYAKRELENLRIENSDNDEDYLKLEVEINKGLYKLEAARFSMEKLAVLRPDSLDYKYDLARLYFDSAQYENAAKLITLVLSQNDKYVNAYILAGKVYIKMYDFSGSLKMAEATLKLDMNNTEAFYLKALSLMGLGQFEDSIAVSKTLLSYSPDKAEAFALIGACYAEMGKYDTSLYYYNEAVVIDTSNADYFLNIAVLHEHLNNPKEVIRYLFLANVIKPDNREIGTRLVDAYISNKQYKLAMKLLKTQCMAISEAEIRRECEAKIKEVEGLYKSSVNPLKYLLWKAFRM